MHGGTGKYIIRDCDGVSYFPRVFGKKLIVLTCLSVRLSVSIFNTTIQAFRDWGCVWNVNGDYSGGENKFREYRTGQLWGFDNGRFSAK